MASLTTKDLFFNHKLGPFSLWQRVGTLRKQIKASEQGTKQVGTCFLRYLYYSSGQSECRRKSQIAPSPTTDERASARFRFIYMQETIVFFHR